MPPRLCPHLRPSKPSWQSTIISIRWSSTSAKPHEPLRILFCGADAFSIPSLHALHDLHKRRPDKIASIDVVCKPDARVGRGLKQIQEVPIKSHATVLSLPLHQLPTFTRWTPPTPPNLIITVSFGLLVPARLLSAATYGGLNLHPSLLPDLRGPAPLQHALLKRRQSTGVSLQTMHPTEFDRGVVLARSGRVGIPADASWQGLLETLAPLGAEVLVRGLEEGVFVPPLVGLGAEDVDGGELAHAPKITPEDRRVLWGVWGAEEVVLRDRVLGRLWVGSLEGRTGRAVFAGPWRVVEGEVGGVEAGRAVLVSGFGGLGEEVGFGTADGRVVVPAGITIDGGKKGQGGRVVIEMLKGKR